MSHQSKIRQLAESIVALCEEKESSGVFKTFCVKEKCSNCKKMYPYDGEAFCDECAGRLTVEIPCAVQLDEPFDNAEWLDESDIVEVIAA